MLPTHLAALENAAEPYMDIGYRVFSQTDSSLTLMRERPRFSVIIFIILLVVFWPAAIIYSAVNRSRRDDIICLRVTSQGYIEATGDTSENVGSRVSLTTFVLIVLGAVLATMVLFIMLIRH